MTASPFPVPDDIQEYGNTMPLLYVYLWHEGPSTMSEVVEATGVAQSTTSARAGRLEELGLIEKSPNPTDATSTFYVPTYGPYATTADEWLEGLTA